MHIVHVIVGLDVGGAELMLTRLITDSKLAGEFRHSIISLTTVGPVGTRLQADGIPVHALGLTSPAAIVHSFWRLRRMLSTLQPDIVHTWMYHADFLGGLAAVSAGYRKIIWSIRTTIVDYEDSRLTRCLARTCARLSRRIPQVIICAAEASRIAHAALGYDTSRMIVVSNGLDLSALKAGSEARVRMRSLFGFADETIAIGAAGRFTPVKDFRNFIHASAHVAKLMPSARFILAGRGLTRENAQLMTWISESGLNGSYILLGERDDMPACLSAMDVFCLSSRSEGFPNVVGEAMGVGVPCVVTNVGAAAFLIGNTGEVVPKEDPQALGAALTRMATLAPVERRALGASARLRIEQHFSMEHSRRQFENIYRRVFAELRVAT